MRKIIQVIQFEEMMGRLTLKVLCDDGTIWKLHNGTWTHLPIPLVRDKE